MSQIQTLKYKLRLSDGLVIAFTSELGREILIDPNTEVIRYYRSDRVVELTGDGIQTLIDIEASDRLNPGFDGRNLRDRPSNLPLKITNQLPVVDIKTDLFHYADYFDNDNGVTIALNIVFDDLTDLYKLQFSATEYLVIKTKSLSPTVIAFQYHQEDNSNPGVVTEKEVDFSLIGNNLSCLFVIADRLGVYAKDPAKFNSVADLSGSFAGIIPNPTTEISETIAGGTGVRYRTIEKKVATKDDALLFLGNNLETYSDNLLNRLKILEEGRVDTNTVAFYRNTLAENLAAELPSGTTVLDFLKQDVDNILLTIIAEEDLTADGAIALFGDTVTEIEEQGLIGDTVSTVLAQSTSYAISLDGTKVIFRQTDLPNPPLEVTEVSERVLLPVYTGFKGVKTIRFYIRGVRSSFTQFSGLSIFREDGTKYVSGDFTISDLNNIGIDAVSTLMGGETSSLPINTTASWLATFNAPATDLVRISAFGRADAISSQWGWIARDADEVVLFQQNLINVRGTISRDVNLPAISDSNAMALQHIKVDGKDVFQIINNGEIFLDVDENGFNIPQLSVKAERTGFRLTLKDGSILIQDSETLAGGYLTQKLILPGAGKWGVYNLSEGEHTIEIWCKSTTPKLTVAFLGGDEYFGKAWDLAGDAIAQSAEVTSDSGATFETIEVASKGDDGHYLKFKMSSTNGGELRLGSYAADFDGLTAPFVFDLAFSLDRSVIDGSILAYQIADTNPGETGVTWLDAATVTDFPTHAQQNSLLRNDTTKTITLDGTAIAPQEIYRFTGKAWSKWGNLGGKDLVKGAIATPNANEWATTEDIANNLQKKCFHYFNEGDQPVGTATTKWQINPVPTDENDGFTIYNNTDIKFPKNGRYLVMASGGQNNSSSFNALLWSALNFKGSNVSAGTFLSIEIDGVGSKSGAVQSLHATVTVTNFNNDTLYAYSGGQQASVLSNRTITITEI